MRPYQSGRAIRISCRDLTNSDSAVAQSCSLGPHKQLFYSKTLLAIWYKVTSNQTCLVRERPSESHLPQLWSLNAKDWVIVGNPVAEAPGLISCVVRTEDTTTTGNTGNYVHWLCIRRA